MILIARVNSRKHRVIFPLCHYFFGSNLRHEKRMQFPLTDRIHLFNPKEKSRFVLYACLMAGIRGRSGPQGRTQRAFRDYLAEYPPCLSGALLLATSRCSTLGDPLIAAVFSPLDYG